MTRRIHARTQVYSLFFFYSHTPNNHDKTRTPPNRTCRHTWHQQCMALTPAYTQNCQALVVHVQFIHSRVFDSSDMCELLELSQTENDDRSLGSLVDDPLQLLYLKLRLLSCRGHQSTAHLWQDIRLDTDYMFLLIFTCLFVNFPCPG